MKDVFMLPVGSYNCEMHEDILNRGRKIIGKFDKEPQAIAAAQAINSHDNLVSMLKSAIKTIQDYTDTPEEPPSDENKEFLLSAELTLAAANDPQFQKLEIKKPRTEYLQWCKEIAAEHLNKDDYLKAWESMVTNLSKHHGTRGHMNIDIGVMNMINGVLDNTPDMRHFIDGFS